MNKENVVCIYNGILFSNERMRLSFVAIWMEQEDIMVSKTGQTQKDKYHSFVKTKKLVS
jgi:hypothetical protein